MTGVQTCALPIWTGEGGPVQALDVSVDNGRTWAPAKFVDAATKWGWRRWEHRWIPAAEGFVTVFARARDRKGDVQPAAQEWNQSGYLWNVIARVDVNVGMGSAATAPNSAANPAAPAGFQNTCMVCHQDDVIRQQRLTRAQWDRELTKMADWGAQVGDGDRSALLDFLVRLSGDR